MAAVKLSVSAPESLVEEMKAYEISPSAVFQAALSAAIDEIEQKRRRIVVPTTAGREGFEGRWIIRPDDDAGLTSLTQYRGEGARYWPAGQHHGVALTKRGHIAVYIPETKSLNFYRTVPDIPDLPDDVMERFLESAKLAAEDPIRWHDEH